MIIQKGNKFQVVFKNYPERVIYETFDREKAEKYQDAVRIALNLRKPK